MDDNQAAAQPPARKRQKSGKEDATGVAKFRRGPEVATRKVSPIAAAQPRPPHLPPPPPPAATAARKALSRPRPCVVPPLGLTLSADRGPQAEGQAAVHRERGGGCAAGGGQSG